MDAVYVLKPAMRDWDHEEARYSVRSLVAAGMDDGIWFVGASPLWAGEELRVIRTTLSRTGYGATSDNLLAAIRCPDISDPFIYWNDDFHAIGATEVLPYFRGTLEERLTSRRTTDSYRAGALHAFAFLQGRGIPDPLDYDLHIPMVVQKAAMMHVILCLRDGRLSEAYKRSVYGNIVSHGGHQRDDVKVGGQGREALAGDWVSTSDKSFRKGWVGRYLQGRFDEPTRYERETDA